VLGKEKLLDHIQERTLREAILKILDKADVVLRKHDTKFTDFLTPNEVKMALNVLNGISGIKYIVNGGYENSERKVIIIFPDYLEENMIELPISVFEIIG